MMALTGLEIVLIPCVTTTFGIVVGRAWGKKGSVTMERCGLVHKSIDEKLETIGRKLDHMNGGSKGDEKDRKK